MADPFLLAAAFFVAAVLYASVGHAGASGYLAVMALLGVAPAVARPTALALNILVASIVTFRFWRAGLVDLRRVVPFVVGSVPFAFVGGAIDVPDELYKPLLGAVLVLAGAGFARTAASARDDDAAGRRPPLLLAIICGAGIGLVSGLTGTGGGIFLSPLLLVAGWSTTREASGVASVFILANSIAGLTGNIAAVGGIPAELPLWAAAVLFGALLGSEIGTRRARVPHLRLALAAVLIIAGLKLIFIG